MWAIQIMAQLYIYYYQTVKRDPRFTEQNYAKCKEYYDKVFKEIEQRIDKKILDDIFAQTMAQQSVNMQDFVAEKTVYQFIKEL